MTPSSSPRAAFAQLACEQIPLPIDGATWDLGIVTVCPDHQTLLIDTCPQGAALGDRGWLKDLPYTLHSHRPTDQCPGCDLRQATPPTLDDPAGIALQQALMAKLGVTTIDGAPIAHGHSASPAFSLPTMEFWTAFEAGLTVASQAARYLPSVIRDPLNRNPVIEEPVQKQGFIGPLDRYAMYCLVSTVLGWLVGDPESLNGAIGTLLYANYQVAGVLNLPDSVGSAISQSAFMSQLVRTQIGPIINGWQSVYQIADQRDEIGLTGDRLGREALRLGLGPTWIATCDSDLGLVRMPPFQARILATTQLTCLESGCSEPAVQGQGDYKFCADHEMRCLIPRCSGLMFAGRCTTNRRHVQQPLQRGLVTSAEAAAMTTAMPSAIETASPLRLAHLPPVKASRPVSSLRIYNRKPPCSYVDDAGRRCSTIARVEFGGRLCTKHGRLAGIVLKGSKCGDCTNWALCGTGYCQRHARLRNIKIPGYFCRDTTCHASAKPYGGFCAAHRPRQVAIE